MGARATRIVLGGLLLTVVMAAAGYSASGGSQSVSVAAAPGLDITVPGAAASIASTVPGSCGSTTSTINVKSNKVWNLQMRSSASYPNGKAMNGATEMASAFQYKGGDVASFTSITSTYANLYGSSQPKTATLDVVVSYQQCVSYLDDPGTYTIVVEYLGVQP